MGGTKALKYQRKETWGSGKTPAEWMGCNSRCSRQSHHLWLTLPKAVLLSETKGYWVPTPYQLRWHIHTNTSFTVTRPLHKCEGTSKKFLEIELKGFYFGLVLKYIYSCIWGIFEIAVENICCKKPTWTWNFCTEITLAFNVILCFLKCPDRCMCIAV